MSSFLSKVELKYQLQQMGIKVVEGNYVRKKDVAKILLGDVVVSNVNIKLVYIHTNNVEHDFSKIKKATGWNEDEILNTIYDGLDLEDLFTGTDLVIALHGNKVVGFGNFIAGVYAKDIWVDEQYRRQGIATDMHKLVEEKTHQKFRTKHPEGSDDYNMFWKSWKKTKVQKHR